MSRQGSQAYSLNKILSPISQREKKKNKKIHQQWIKIKNIFWKHKNSLQTGIPQKQISPLWPGKRLTIIYSSWSVWGSSEITVFVIMLEMICRKKILWNVNMRETKLKCSSGIFLVLHLSYFEPPCSNIYMYLYICMYIG